MFCYPQEGHGFAVPENSLSFNAVAETFLAAHLGGRCEPFGDDFHGAEFEVRMVLGTCLAWKKPLADRG